MILSMSEYPKIPRILFHKGLWLEESWDDPEHNNPGIVSGSLSICDILE